MTDPSSERQSELTVTRAVFASLQLLKAANPALARHFETVPDVLTAWTIACEDYEPEVILAAARKMLKGLKSETRDYVPDAFRLSAICEEITRQNAIDARERAWRESEARHAIEAKPDQEIAARYADKIRSLIGVDVPNDGPGMS